MCFRSLFLCCCIINCRVFSWMIPITRDNPTVLVNASHSHSIWDLFLLLVIYSWTNFVRTKFTDSCTGSTEPMKHRFFLKNELLFFMIPSTSCYGMCNSKFSSNALTDFYLLRMKKKIVITVSAHCS